jgi:hypothetical protein
MTFKKEWLLWAMVIISLAINIAMISSLLRIREAAAGALAQTEGQLRQLVGEEFVYTVPLKQAVPVHAAIPFRRDLQVPIKTTIPISQTLSLSIKTPLGMLPITTPLNVNVPVDLKFTVPVSETIDIDTTVELQTTIPVTISLQSTPFGKYLANAADQLKLVQESMR